MTTAYILPLRNDIDGVNLQVRDLLPNSSLRRLVLDGEGQTGYVTYSLDTPATTTVSGEDYVSGSLTTYPIGAVTDATLGATHFDVTTATEFGMLAYLRDVVNVNPGGNNDYMTPTEALDVFGAIATAAYNGSALTLTAINTILNDNLAGADTDLDGTASDSFGEVTDVLRLLAGEAYRVKANTILGSAAHLFRNLTERAAQVATYPTYVQRGAFLSAGTDGYRDIRAKILSGALRASVAEGQLEPWCNGNAVTLLNPNFGYSAGGITSWHPRAYRIDGTVVPTTGSARMFRVYDSNGNCLG